jgi:hypothetical protein
MVAAYAAWKAIARPPVESGMRLTSAFIGIEIGAQYLIVATFFLFELVARSLKSSHFHHRRILIGFSVASSGMLIGTLVRSEFGNRFAVLSQYASVVAYLATLLIWISAFCRPLQELDHADGIEAQAALHELQTYKDVLRKADRWTL